MRILNENGVLYFSNNRRKFKLSSITQDKYQVTNITPRTIPLDYHDQKIHHTFKITAKVKK
jgi:23S rRNA (cytosine1962-C5)-methyltransferase/23S rRNA (guanine2445-N2)-methyltransferase / 23S rRNA (guanine2069-N7)-methyltransferase